MVENVRTTSEGDEVIGAYQPTDDDFIKVYFESLDVLIYQPHPLYEPRLFSSWRDSIRLSHPHPYPPTLPSPHPIHESLLGRLYGQQITH